MRRSMSTLWVVALAALLLIALLGATVPGSGAVAPQQTVGPISTAPGCTPAATAGRGTPNPTACTVYECCERNGASVAVLGTDTAHVVAYATAQPAYQFLVLDVAVENVSSSDEVPYSPFYFRLRAADGTQYDAEYLGPEPELSSGRLNKGDRVRGKLAFEVPSSAEGLMLIYEPIAYPSYEIRIMLERPGTS